MHTVYAIYNRRHDKIYIGQTDNLEKRLDLHNSKYFQNCYTAGFTGEWVLIYKEAMSTRTKAVRRERQLKSYRGRQFVKSHIPG